MIAGLPAGAYTVTATAEAARRHRAGHGRRGRPVTQNFTVPGDGDMRLQVYPERVELGDNR